MNNKKKEIGRRIRGLREQLGMSQEQLANLIGYKSASSRSTINKVELGINDITQSKLPKYAAALHTTIEYLLGIDENSLPSEEQINEWDKTKNIENISMEVKLIEEIQKQYGKKAVLLLQYFTELNEKGKDKAIAAILDLSEVPKYKKG